MEIGPGVRALPATLARELGLRIGQSDVVRPPIAADRRPVRAMIVAAIDQQPANA